MNNFIELLGCKTGLKSLEFGPPYSIPFTRKVYKEFEFSYTSYE
jgi:hypothetical protein